jgi:three-Cys-motif partner protein
VVFVDPFGMQVPWATFERLASTKAIEVFVNFPVNMAIQRLLKRSGKFSDKERKKLDDYFGDPSWYDLLYRETPTLFGTEVQKATGSGDKLVNWYRDRLKALFGYASAAYLVSSTRNRPLYYLVHAGPNETGAKIATDVLKAGARVPAATAARQRKR